MTAYLVDSNVFIQARNLHYGFDICPAFWDWMVEQNGAKRVASIEKVADELTRREIDASIPVTENSRCPLSAPKPQSLAS